MKILHIGLGKCGSNFFQDIVFREIAKSKNIQFIKLVDFLNAKSDFHDLENYFDLEKKFSDQFIISHEGLFSKTFEFNNLEKSFDIVKKNFSKDTIILIFIRNPYDLLNSIYCQSIHQMNIIKEKNFFYYEKNFDQRKNKKFNLYNFDYDILIKLYESYFNKVYVVKYENMLKFNYLKSIFKVNDDFINNLNLIKQVYSNRSISYYGIKTLLFLNRYINLKQYDQLLRKNIKKTRHLPSKIKNFFLSQFLLRDFFQKKFDKIFPYKKYYIDTESIPIDIKHLNYKYKKKYNEVF